MTLEKSCGLNFSCFSYFFAVIGASIGFVISSALERECLIRLPGLKAQCSVSFTTEEAATVPAMTSEHKVNKFI